MRLWDRLLRRNTVSPRKDVKPNDVKTVMLRLCRNISLKRFFAYAQNDEWCALEDIKPMSHKDIEGPSLMLMAPLPNPRPSRGEGETSNHISRSTFHLSHGLAFTLAEVLITLGIIGLVAEITIPTLMHNFQTQVTVTSLKKTFSVLSSAYTTSVQENGPPNNWTLGADWSTDGAKKLSDMFAPYLSIAKYCGAAEGCAPNANYKRLKKVQDFKNFYPADGGGSSKIELNDGSLLHFVAYKLLNYFGTSYFGFVYVDVNGAKPPNQEGIDWFIFFITDKGIVPAGTAAGNGLYTFADYCGKVGALGEGCTAWVIYNENLDYTKCPGKLSWDGTTKCP